MCPALEVGKKTDRFAQLQDLPHCSDVGHTTAGSLAPPPSSRTRIFAGWLVPRFAARRLSIGKNHVTSPVEPSKTRTEPKRDALNAGEALCHTKLDLQNLAT
jgi:hypothetical protein